MVAKTRLGLNPSLNIERRAGPGRRGASAAAPVGRRCDFRTDRWPRLQRRRWNGAHAQGAINSSLAAGSSPADAVGYRLGSEIVTNVDRPVHHRAGDVLVRYTSYGDADLNGVVNFDDYARTDPGFANSRTGWVNGDFDYDNVVNFDDYA